MTTCCLCASLNDMAEKSSGLNLSTRQAINSGLGVGFLLGLVAETLRGTGEDKGLCQEHFAEVKQMHRQACEQIPRVNTLIPASVLNHLLGKSEERKVQ